MVGRAEDPCEDCFVNSRGDYLHVRDTKDTVENGRREEESQLCLPDPEAAAALEQLLMPGTDSGAVEGNTEAHQSELQRLHSRMNFLMKHMETLARSCSDESAVAFRPPMVVTGPRFVRDASSKNVEPDLRRIVNVSRTRLTRGEPRPSLAYPFSAARERTNRRNTKAKRAAATSAKVAQTK